MTDERQRDLARLGRIRRWVTVGSLAAFGAFFGLAAEHAVGTTQSGTTTPVQQEQQPSRSQSDDFFSGGDDGGDRSGGFGFGGSAPQTPPAGQSRVS